MLGNQIHLVDDPYQYFEYSGSPDEPYNKTNKFLLPKIHNIIGLPVKDPLKVDFETLDFNIKLKPHVAGCSILYPYPGTEVSHLAKEMGMFDGNHEKVQISNKSSSNLQFGSKKVQRMINNFHKLFPIILWNTYLCINTFMS